MDVNLTKLIGGEELTEFEESAYENGQTWWDARWLMEKLGYKNWTSFFSVINEAIGSCMRLGVVVTDTFQQSTVLVEGQPLQSFKLNRFACYLIAMHADIKKDEVLKIRGYLAAFAAAIAERRFQDDALLRVEFRERLKDGEALMSGVAFQAGVKGSDMAVFKDAGYQGLYNMSRTTLMQRRGLKIDDVIYNYMGVIELAANNYRVTQTAERIRSQNLKGVAAASKAAKEIGESVRRDVIKNTGTVPEALKLEEDIKRLSSSLKKANRGMKKLDEKKNKKKPSKKRKSEE